MMRRKLSGGVLSAAVVVAVLMMLVVMGVMAIWDADFLLFARANRLRMQRANIESAMVLYSLYPRILEELDEEGMLQLFDSMPSSCMKLTRTPWGLYETVTVESHDGKAFRTSIFGEREPYRDECVLWYENNGGALTLTGDSHIRGSAYLPDRGIAYGRMQSVFFSGDPVRPASVKISDRSLPVPTPAARGEVERLFGLLELPGDPMPDSLRVPFRRTESTVVRAEKVSGSYLSGNVIVIGDRIEVDADAELHDILVVANTIVVRDGFRGSVQLFAADSIFIGDNVVLQYPSGLFSRVFAEIGDRTEIEGYLIVACQPEADMKRPACRKSRLSTLRGLFYCSGVAEFQGITSGCAFLQRSVYLTPQAHYNDILHDVTLLGNNRMCYPLWLETPPRRKEAKWVR